MTLVSGPLLPFVSLAAPLFLAFVAALPGVRGHALSLLPIAPLPALLFALAGAPQGETAAPPVLLGVTLGLDENARLFLGSAAFLWLAAAAYALRYLGGTHRPGVFAAFWCLTLAGNLGVFLARDVATFYVAFSAVSLAAWVLVVHEETAGAIRAGRVYIILAVAGETALLVGLLLAASAAGSLAMADVRSALGEGFAERDAAIALIVAGLGVKAGLVPLHVWLPLAHPEAPTPASAVLSGAIVKAGIFGLVVLLPTEGAPGWGVLLTWAGLGTAWFGILVGLAQRESKAVLAYSTVSQMGLLVALAGAGIAGAFATSGTAAFYAAHHGLAKGALFLGVGVVLAAGGRTVVPVVAVMAAVAASVAGFPLTGGSVAKAAIKEPFQGFAGALVGWSAVGTALLLAHAIARALAERASHRPEGAPAATLVVPWVLTAAAALALPWLLLGASTDLSAAYLLEPGHLWSAFWPVALAALVAVVGTVAGARLPRLPPGDLVLAADWLGGMAARAAARVRAQSAGFRDTLRTAPLRRTVDPLALERRLRAWSLAGLLAVVAAIVLA